MDKSISNQTSSTCTSTSGSATSKLENKTTEVDTRRLWIGNLDPKLTEFHLLKLIQSFGTIQQFDFLFHRSGPYVGQPRGYAFVTFKDAYSAQKCIRQLDSRRIMDKSISVRWANQASQGFQDEEEKIRNKIPALGIKATEKPLNKSKTISAIEAKLRCMEGDMPNFTLSTTSLHSPAVKTQSSINSDVGARSKPYDRIPKTSKTYLL